MPRLDLNKVTEGGAIPVVVPKGIFHGDWCRGYCYFRRFRPDTCAASSVCIRNHDRAENSQTIYISDEPRPDGVVAPDWLRDGLPEP